MLELGNLNNSGTIHVINRIAEIDSEIKDLINKINLVDSNKNFTADNSEDQIKELDKEFKLKEEEINDKFSINKNEFTKKVNGVKEEANTIKELIDTNNLKIKELEKDIVKGKSNLILELSNIETNETKQLSIINEKYNKIRNTIYEDEKLKFNQNKNKMLEDQNKQNKLEEEKIINSLKNLNELLENSNKEKNDLFLKIKNLNLQIIGIDQENKDLLIEKNRIDSKYKEDNKKADLKLINDNENAIFAYETSKKDQLEKLNLTYNKDEISRQIKNNSELISESENKLSKEKKLRVDLESKIVNNPILLEKDQIEKEIKSYESEINDFNIKLEKDLEKVTIDLKNDLEKNTDVIYQKLNSSLKSEHADLFEPIESTIGEVQQNQDKINILENKNLEMTKNLNKIQENIANKKENRMKSIEEKFKKYMSNIEKEIEEINKNKIIEEEKKIKEEIESLLAQKLNLKEPNYEEELNNFNKIHKNKIKEEQESFLNTKQKYLWIFQMKLKS